MDLLTSIALIILGIIFGFLIGYISYKFKSKRLGKKAEKILYPNHTPGSEGSNYPKRVEEIKTDFGPSSPPNNGQVKSNDVRSVPVRDDTDWDICFRP